MKEELMLLGFISLLLTTASSVISNICLPSKFDNGTFAPCIKSEVDENRENKDLKERILLMAFALQKRVLNTFNQNTCGEAEAAVIGSLQEPLLLPLVEKTRKRQHVEYNLWTPDVAEQVPINGNSSPVNN